MFSGYSVGIKGELLHIYEYSFQSILCPFRSDIIPFRNQKVENCRLNLSTRSSRRLGVIDTEETLAQNGIMKFL